ncbi:MAG TPA: YqaJ viral recombinase family protein [Candidatus Paceibacterota bacterium]
MVEQRSPEWFALRRGKVTASRVGDILATLRNGSWAASRKNYAAQLVTERLMGKDPEPFMNEAIQWGIDQEPHAKLAYTNKTGLEVVDVHFVNHPRLVDAGASPDGFVGEDGLLEIKCPTTATHIETLLGSDLKEQYRLQMLWQMACTGRQWCDFVSFDPRLPEEMSLYIRRYERDEKEIAHVENEIEAFLHEVQNTVDALKEKYVQ